MTHNKDAIRVFTTQGVVMIGGLDEWHRSIVGSHWNAIRRLLEDGNDAQLGGLRFTLHHAGGRSRFGGYELEFDPDVIEREGARGDVRFESIYEADQ